MQDDVRVQVLYLEGNYVEFVDEGPKGFP